jgi:succinate dehydrogenase/fumarate reductase cytochrome b subunit
MKPSVEGLTAGATEAIGIHSRFFRILPPIACLIYPALVSLIPGVSPFFLLPVLLVPICCAYVAFHIAGTGFLKASAIAHFGIGAPALYSLMGQWLDSQKLFPFHANEAWVAVWLLLTAISFVDQPAIRSQVSRSSHLPMIHGISAVPIVLFAALHLTNHLVGLWGGQAHIAFMTWARRAYRYPAVEIALVSCFLFQFVTGIVLTWRGIVRGLADDWMKRLQRISGAYLALFLMSHFSAVARARYLRHTDTNWIWLTSSNLLTDQWSVRLTPYYFLGIVALSLHAACALRFVLIAHGRQPLAANRIFCLVVGFGSIAAMAIMIGLVQGSFHL